MSITQAPIVQPPLMDVLDNKSEEPMSLRSMLRFSRGNVSGQSVYIQMSPDKIYTILAGIRLAGAVACLIHGVATKFVSLGSCREKAK